MREARATFETVPKLLAARPPQADNQVWVGSALSIIYQNLLTKPRHETVPAPLSRSRHTDPLAAPLCVEAASSTQDGVRRRPDASIGRITSVKQCWRSHERGTMASGRVCIHAASEQQCGRDTGERAHSTTKRRDEHAPRHNSR